MISVIIPVCNPDYTFKELLKTLKGQTVEAEIIIIDSSDDKGLIDELISPFKIDKMIKIRQEDFSHGATRNLGLSIAEGDVLVYLTQDALPASNSAIERLVQTILNDKTVGAACGRQLPRNGASPVEAHARLFNYPDSSDIRSFQDRARLGIKTAFISNSFSAYRRTALQEVGGFPSNVIMSEDMYVAAKMLMKGWKIAYCADAMVYHSHNYSIWQEFKRYFDTGVFHGRERWILETFGKAEGEGLRFMLSEFKYLLKENPFLIPLAIIRNTMKFAGYKLGYAEMCLPCWLKYRLSMNRSFWLKNPAKR